MKREWLQQFQQVLGETLGSAYGAVQLRPSGTGCINDTWEAFGPGIESLFIKTGPASAHAMYCCEQQGLDALRQCESIRVPQVLANLVIGDHAALVLEFVPLQSLKGATPEHIAAALAQLHSIAGHEFGFQQDNFIGRTPQINQPQADWWTFWCECRMQPQWRLAQLKNMRPALLDKIARLIERIPAAFSGHQPQAVLQHGDLWSGNMALDERGNLCLFDPAVYYGDRETDIAMSRMFGAMDERIYAAYHRIHPLQAGAEQRRVLYDLYHWMNHFNLFGVTYLGQVENSVDDLLNWMG